MSRCKRHTTDLSSTVGVCASCLRERLLAIIAAQAKAHKLVQLEQSSEHLNFPRSVSPYVTRRKSDTSAAWHLPNGHAHHEAVHGRWFYSTPQVGPTGSVTFEAREKRRSRKTKLSSLFSGFFRSKDDSMDRRSSESSSSWLSSVFATRRRKQKKTCSLDESASAATVPVPALLGNRGMSPARRSADYEDGDNSSDESSESSSWRRRRSNNTPANNSATRRRTPAAGSSCRNGPSGLAFCLSPLVRASPNHRNWSQELAIGVDSRVPHLSNAPSFCKSRSRKLADFGRYNSYSGKCNR